MTTAQPPSRTGAGQLGVMAEHGYYAQHSQPQHDASAIGLDVLATAAGDVTLPPHGPLVVVDFGSAQGHNSLHPVATALDALAVRVDPSHAHAMVVVHTDLPGNDWATLFHVLDDDPASYLHDRPNVHAYVAGRSFYDRVFPPSSITLGWTSSTLHWLRVDPGPIADHFFVQSSRDATAQERYRSQSVRDWLDFLDARAIELQPGASVVFVDTVMGDDGLMGGEGLFDLVQSALAAAHADGTLSDAQFAALAYPTWFRSVAELRSPFDSSGRRANGGRLELGDLQTVDLGDPLWPMYERAGDARAYAEAQIAFVRGFLEPSFTAQLSATTPAGSRPPDLTAAWSAAVTAVAADPASAAPSWRLVRGRIRRTPD